jgi:hypothetical protein
MQKKIVIYFNKNFTAVIQLRIFSFYANTKKHLYELQKVFLKILGIFFLERILVFRDQFRGD